MAVATQEGNRMNQYDVMYIDDGRNADHRAPTRWSSRPSSPTVVVPPSQRPTVIYPRQNTPATMYGPPYGPYPVSYGTPQVLYGPPSSFASRFGMSTGELIDSAIQILAAIQPLPAAPVAQGDSGLDVENLVTYQGALATHAKRDEQLRTLGTGGKRGIRRRSTGPRRPPASTRPACRPTPTAPPTALADARPRAPRKRRSWSCSADVHARAERTSLAELTTLTALWSLTRRQAPIPNLPRRTPASLPPERVRWSAVTRLLHRAPGFPITTS